MGGVKATHFFVFINLLQLYNFQNFYYMVLNKIYIYYIISVIGFQDIITKKLPFSINSNHIQTLNL